MLGNMCNDATHRFQNFGTCLSETPTFQSLNSTFWYQAARKALCGYSMEGNFTNYIQPHNNMAVKQKSDTQIELEAQYLYVLNNPDSSIDSEIDSEMKTEVSSGEVHAEKRDGTYGLAQCLNTCELFREGSNAVQNCWQVTGLTVIYGVCEAGCRYYY